MALRWKPLNTFDDKSTLDPYGTWVNVDFERCVYGIPKAQGV